MLVIPSPDEGRKDSINLPTANFLVYPGANDEVADEKYVNIRVSFISDSNLLNALAGSEQTVLNT